MRRATALFWASIRRSSAPAVCTARPPGRRRQRRCWPLSGARRTRSSRASASSRPRGQSSHHEVTAVTFRPLTARDIASYVASGEWQGRAGAYAIQGLGAALVERIEGDYLNVVGLPAALLIRLLAERFAGTYGIG